MIRLRSLLRTVGPLLAVVLASVLELRGIPAGLADVGPVALRFSAGLVVVLGWRLQRGRAVWAAVVALGATEARTALAPGAPEVGLGLGLAVLGLGVSVAWVEAPLRSRRSALRGLAVVGVVLLVAATGRPEMEPLLLAGENAARSLWGGVAETPVPVLGHEVAPGAAASIALGGLLVGLIGWGVKRRSLDGGLVALLVAVGVPVVLPGLAAASTRMAVVGLGALAFSLVEGAARLAFEDPLTRLPARRALEERLDRLSGDFCLAMLDLDHFKKLNDRYGHDVGDQVLEMVASRVARVGAGGEAYRYGGEEMTVVFDRRSLDEAEAALEGVRREIADHPFRQRSARRKGGAGSGGRRIPVTVSIGLADATAGSSSRAVLEAADKALYRAKKAGRNRIARARRRRSR